MSNPAVVPKLDPGAPRSTPLTPLPNSQAARILVIDDNPSIHDDIRKTLGVHRGKSDLEEQEAALFGNTHPAAAAPQHFEIGAALDGRGGVQLAQAARDAGQSYMVAFVDMRMPAGWDGLETVERLWSVDPSIQVVICTAYSDHSWGEIAHRLGHSDNWLVLKKPFETIEVLQAAHALSQKWVLCQQVTDHVTFLEETVERRTSDLERLNADLSQEIEVRRTAEDNLKHLATHDSLTGLPNRILMRERLSLALARSRRYGKHVAVLLLDLDNFKEVNDSLGHDAGDRMLCEIGDRLRTCVREADTVARLGGDEFVITLTDMGDYADVDIVLGRLQEALSLPVQVFGHALPVSTSIGISTFPADCSDAEGMIKCADLALYAAKAAGRAVHRHYSPVTATEVRARVGLRDELRGALEREELELWYQPLVDLSDATIVGMEALLRWRHPDHGILAPHQFLPIAEEAGLIVPIGRWVLEQACRQSMIWQREAGRRMPVSVNLSPRQFEHAELLKDIESALASAGLAPSDLEIEMTESCVMKDIERSARVLTAVHDLGVRIAIDDFGSGYSSLARLKLLPVDTLKLDRMFIQDIVDDERDAAIVAAVIALAGSLGIQVVAEGIETAEQLDLLRSLDCDPGRWIMCQRGQGHLFSRAMPASHAGEALQSGALTILP